jgi:hypothetical protein
MSMTAGRMHELFRLPSPEVRVVRGSSRLAAPARHDRERLMAPWMRIGKDALSRARAEIAKAVVGHREVIDQLLIALICEGHVELAHASPLVVFSRPPPGRLKPY